MSSPARDEDGFSVEREGEERPQVIPPPPMVEMPGIFDGCGSSDHAIARMIGELGKPASIELDGFDTMYRRLADALILVLANQGGLTP